MFDAYSGFTGINTVVYFGRKFEEEQMSKKKYELIDMEPQARARMVRDEISRKYNTTEKLLAFVKKLESESGPRNYVDLSVKKSTKRYAPRKKKSA